MLQGPQRSPQPSPTHDLNCRLEFVLPKVALARGNLERRLSAGPALVEVFDMGLDKRIAGLAAERNDLMD